ncbi:MAG: hypothetical protein M3123_02715 [Actinomycetota bacterium]|nr:hypothetical protein [Actinomycetota bacterium]
MSVEFLAPTVAPEEDELERSLRPRKLEEFVGQERIKEQLSIALEATRGRGDALDHVLLVGRRPAPCDRARGRGTLPGHPGHRQEDRRAHSARAEGHRRR